MWKKRIMKFDLNEKKNHHETIAQGEPDFITI